MKKNNFSYEKVSIVIPVYNKKDDIGEMLESIYKQVWDNIELVFVNDGATDGTRDILTEWKNIFDNRGYMVIIIDQENQGISAAVRNGMLRMTGDYFCSVDCDDYLHPEYVSTMASWLAEHPEYDYAACGFEKLSGTRKDYKLQEVDEEWTESSDLVESALLQRIRLVSWRYLVRKSYLDRCRIVDNFVTEPRLQQEPSIVIPLLALKGRMKYFSQPLYRYNVLDRRLCDITERKKVHKLDNYVKDYTHVLRTVIKSLPLENDRIKQKYISLCDYYELKLYRLYHRDILKNDSDENTAFAQQIVKFIQRHFTPSPVISKDDVLAVGIVPLFFALDNCILEVKSELIKEKLDRQCTRRIVYYGALGDMAKQIIPALEKTPLKPDILWDIAAGKGSRINGITVNKPQYEDLSKDDMFVILPISAKSIYNHICSHLLKAGIQNIVLHDDLMQYLVEHYLPEFKSYEYRFLA